MQTGVRSSPYHALLYGDFTEGYEIDLWNFRHSTWDSFPQSSMAQFWRTDLVQTTDVTDYVSGSNVRARILAKPSGSSYPSKWTTSYDQAEILWK